MTDQTLQVTKLKERIYVITFTYNHDTIYCFVSKQASLSYVRIFYKAY